MHKNKKIGYSLVPKTKQSVRGDVSKALKKKKKVPPGYHRMPDGSLMKGDAHPTNSKKY